VPKIILQSAEEIFPALRETMVSVLCLCSQKSVFLSSVSSHGERNQIFYDMLVLVFIIHGVSFIIHGCTHYKSGILCRKVIN
jgi:hypothetical protein